MPAALFPASLSCRVEDGSAGFGQLRQRRGQKNLHALIAISDDEGETWRRYAVASQNPENRIFYWDQRLAVLEDGRLLDFSGPMTGRRLNS